MSKRIQLRRGTATDHDTFTGADGEVTVDTTNKTLKVHDGTTVGGTALAKVSQLPEIATITNVGLIQVGTQEEVDTGAKNDRAVTPATLRNTIPTQTKLALNASGTAPIYACRAWVNFNGTGTVAIRGSGNVSSITDNGTGNYTINFGTNMPDTNYALVGSSTTMNSVEAWSVSTTTQNLSSAVVVVKPAGFNTEDPTVLSIAIFR